VLRHDEAESVRPYEVLQIGSRQGTVGKLDPRTSIQYQDQVRQILEKAPQLGLRLLAVGDVAVDRVKKLPSRQGNGLYGHQDIADFPVLRRCCVSKSDRPSAESPRYGLESPRAFHGFIIGDPQMAELLTGITQLTAHRIVEVEGQGSQRIEKQDAIR